MRQHVLTNTERSALQGCEHLWFLRYGIGLSSIRREPRYLLMGHWWHEVLRTLWASWATSDLLCLANAKARLDELFRVKNGTAVQADVFSTEAGGWTTEELQDIRTTVNYLLESYHERWRSEVVPGRLLLNEERLRACTVTPSGHSSSWSVYAGRLDKLVERDSGLWVLDHKTSKPDLTRWREENDYRPQMYGYGWLVQKVLKRPVAGVIYDLARNTIPPGPGDYKVLKNGTRLMKTLPTGAIASTFLEALRINGFDLDDVEWYREALPKLQHEEENRFKRVRVRFEPEAMQRVERELWMVTTRARQFRSRTEHLREMVRCRGPRDPWKERAVRALVSEGWRYPRNGNHCRRYNRRCGMYDVCRYASRESLEEMRTRSVYHPEEEEG